MLNWSKNHSISLKKKCGHVAEWASFSLNDYTDQVSSIDEGNYIKEKKDIRSILWGGKTSIRAIARAEKSAVEEWTLARGKHRQNKNLATKEDK